MFDFNTVQSPETNKFLTPGNYKLTVTDIKYETPEGKNPFLHITFTGNEGMMRDRFFITTKALTRLQYLHEGWFGKRLEKPFQSTEEVGAYFTKLFQSDAAKKVSHNVQVQGEESADGKVYTRLSYSAFILDDNAELGSFERDSSEWRANVKKQTNASTATDETNLGNSAPPTTEVVDDLPF